MADVSSLSFLSINAFTNFFMFCLEVRFEWEGFVSSCSHQLWGFIVVSILFCMFLYLFYLRFVVAPFSMCLLLMVQIVFYLWAKTSYLRDLFYLLCGCKTLISILAFRNYVLFLLWYWGPCGTFQFMPSPNNTYAPPICFPSIPPASCWELLSHDLF